MDRPIIYDQAQSRDYDVLWGWREGVYALARAVADLLGTTSTLVTGLAATPTAPTSLAVALAAGSIYQLANVDGTAYGSLSADTRQILQQGFALAQSVLLSTSGLGVGQSRWALIQASFSQVDVIPSDDPTGGILNYFNVNNPTEPLVGPNNDGDAQNTRRTGTILISVIYGAIAATGSEVPPNPTGNSVPLYLVDLAYGQTTISGGQILAAMPSVGNNVPNNYPNAPFIAGLLNSHHGGISGQAPKIMMSELAKVSSFGANSGLAAFYSYGGNPNGNVAGVAAATGVSPPDLCLDTSHNILYFCSVSGNAATAVWTPTSGQAVNFVGGVSTGSANAQVVTPVSPGGFALTPGYSITFTPGYNNTAGTTLAVGGTTATACRKNSGGVLVAFTGNEFTATEPVTLVYNGTYWVLQTSVLGALAFLNLGQWTKNDGAGNITLNVAGTDLQDNGSGALGLAPSGVTAGTYNGLFTVDAKGRIIAVIPPYVSSATAVPSVNSLATFAHSLGVKPSRVRVTLINVNAELGYSPGQEVDITGNYVPTWGGGNDTGITVEDDATSVCVSMGTYGPINIYPKGGGGNGNITPANWNMIVRAWA